LETENTTLRVRHKWTNDELALLKKLWERNYKLSKYEMALLKEIRMLNQRGNPPAENPLLEP